MEISVVITVLNEEASVDGLIQALASQTLLPKEVIVVDGGSTDQTVAQLRRAARTHRNLSIRLMQVTGNRSVGRNAGIQQARSAWIAITDAGCLPSVDWLRALAAASRRSRALVIAGYATATPRSAFEEAVVPYTLVMPDRVDERSFLPATRSLLMQRSVWEQLGGFDETLSDNEDYAFARLLEQRGIARAFARDAVVVWQPRSTLRSFAWMIFRFARGDARAGLWRPKVFLIFARYLAALAVLLFGVQSGSLWPVLAVLAILLLFYLLWAVAKNRRYAPRGWHWLPALQLTSDAMVMLGTCIGLLNRLLNFV